MSDTKENEEACKGDPPVVDSQIIGESSNEASTSQQLTDDHHIILDNLAGLESYLDQEMNLEVQPEIQPDTAVETELKSVTVEQIELKPVTVEKIVLKPVTVEEIEVKPVTVEETSTNVENGSNNIENEKEESPAKDANVKPTVVSEGVPQENVEDTLHSVPVEADAQILNTTECEAASDMKMEVTNLPQGNDSVDNDDTVCQNSVGDAPSKSDKSDEIENDDNVCQNSIGDAPPKSDKGVENDDNVCQNSVGDAPLKSDKSVENDDHVCQNSVSDALPKSDKGVEIETDDNVCQKSVGDCPPKSDNGIQNDDNVCQNSVGDAEPTAVSAVKLEVCEAANTKICDDDPMPSSHNDPTTPQHAPSGTKPELKNVLEVENKADEKQAAEPADNGNSNSKNMFFLDAEHFYDGNESGTEEEQSAFMKELESFFRERSMEFKPPKFYGEGLNCLKLWRAVIRLGGYDKVTSCKLWRQVGESFKPPKTCTTVSWTFRGFYEKALLDYERHNIKGGELSVPVASTPEPMIIENQASASGRARRYAAEQAMRGWHSQRLLGNGEVSDPIIKDRNAVPVQKREKQLKSINLLKRKKPSYMDNAVKAARSKPSKPQLDTSVVDIGPPADWVKVNVQKTKDCFEVYALVPGLLREEVRVQSDPVGRLVISGEPEHPDNPWGVTPFKKVVSLPSRIDPHQTSAVVTLHGQLFTWDTPLAFLLYKGDLKDVYNNILENMQLRIVMDPDLEEHYGVQ